jgi:hypothetical protein
MANLARIRKRMAVVGSCGTFIGNVDCVEGHAIRLTGDSPGAHGQCHPLPLEWVESVDEFVYLDRPCDEVKKDWQGLPSIVEFDREVGNGMRGSGPTRPVAFQERAPCGTGSA